jgi:mRNA-degrading endonuclease RelE of RelBE toxin-antitoxin system
MSYKVELSANFKKEAKNLVKKYPSLKTELAVLFAELEVNPTKGTSLGNDVYKIRLAVASKGKGKSGGGKGHYFCKSY